MTTIHATGSDDELKRFCAAPRCVVQFHATWCRDCINIRPLYRKIVEQQPSTTFVDVDIDKSPDLKKAYGIEHYPTFILYVNGTEQGRVVEPTYEQLEAFLGLAK